MVDDIIVRPAKQDDAEAIGDLWLELVAYHGRLDESMPTAAPDGTRRYAQRIRNSVDDYYTQVYVVEVNEELVGYVMGTIADLLPDAFVAERAGLVADIYVKDTHQRRGLGTSLMQAMKHWFILRGVDHYEWFVAAANKRGIAFWQSQMGGRSIMMRMRAVLKDHDEN